MTGRVGLIGFPIKHSISPAFQQAAFDAERLDVRYEVWELPVEELASVVTRLRGDDYLGANVTIPHKAAIIPLLDEVDPIALAVGAVNTIVHRHDRLIGYNTDIGGFSRALLFDADFDPAGKRAVVCGAGGSARAVVAALEQAGAKQVIVCSRRVEQAVRLIADLRGTAKGPRPTECAARTLDLSNDLEQVVLRADLIVNTTPLGMVHRADVGASALPATWLQSHHVVYDLVYNPPETPLLRAARERGARTLNGLPMLVYQGAAAFERWTGRAAPVELMRRKALEALGV